MKSKDIFTFRDAEKQAGPVAFSTMLKPAGSACNLDCHYCYYLDKAVQYGGRHAIEDSSATLRSDMVFEPGTSWLTIVNALLDAIGRAILPPLLGMVVLIANDAHAFWDHVDRTYLTQHRRVAPGWVLFAWTAVVILIWPAALTTMARARAERRGLRGR